MLPGQPAEHHDRLVGQFDVGREGQVLGLYRGVHHDALQILRRQRAAPVPHRKALLQQRRELFLAQPLAPPRQRRTIEGQRVAKALLAAKVLVVGVLR